MIGKQLRIPALAVVLLAGAQPGYAAVLQCGLGYLDGFVQTGDATVSSTNSAILSATMHSDTDDDVTEGLLMGPGAPNLTLIQSSPRTLNAYSAAYSTVGGLITDYPSGLYMFHAQSGTLAGDMAMLNVPAFDFVNETPGLIGGTWTGLQYCQAGVDQSAMWEPTTNNGTSDLVETEFDIIDLTARSLVHNEVGPGASFTSTTIPGSILVPGHHYGYTLHFIAEFLSTNIGFSGANGLVTNTRYTNGEFQVNAESGTIAGQCFLESYNYPTAYPVSIELFDENNVSINQENVLLGFNYYYAVQFTPITNGTLKFSSPRFLTKAVTALDTMVGWNALDVGLYNGDVDGDNEVGPGDFGELSTAFGSVPGDGNWNPMADLDGDFEVGPSDFGILSTNFGMSGD